MEIDERVVEAARDWLDLRPHHARVFVAEGRAREVVRREEEEETGYRIAAVKEVFSAYMSPGSVTGRLHFFTAEYTPADRVSVGGGHEGEGEDIEVIEVTLEDALAMIDRGEIADAKTIMLVYHAALKSLT